MNEAGKGSGRRPTQMSKEDFDNNWDAIFKKNTDSNKSKKEIPAEAAAKVSSIAKKPELIRMYEALFTKEEQEFLLRFLYNNRNIDSSNPIGSNDVGNFVIGKVDYDTRQTVLVKDMLLGNVHNAHREAEELNKFNPDDPRYEVYRLVKVEKP